MTEQNALRLDRMDYVTVFGENEHVIVEGFEEQIQSKRAEMAMRDAFRGSNTLPIRV